MSKRISLNVFLNPRSLNCFEISLIQNTINQEVLRFSQNQEIPLNQYKSLLRQAGVQQSNGCNTYPASVNGILTDFNQLPNYFTSSTYYLNTHYNWTTEKENNEGNQTHTLQITNNFYLNPYHTKGWGEVETGEFSELTDTFKLTKEEVLDFCQGVVYRFSISLGISQEKEELLTELFFKITTELDKIDLKDAKLFACMSSDLSESNLNLLQYTIY